MIQQITEWFSNLEKESPKITEFVLSSGALIGRLILALFIFLIGRWFAKVFSRGTKKLFKRIGADRLAERLQNIDIIGKTNVDFVPSELLSKTIYYLLLFAFIWTAASIAQIEALTNMIELLFAYFPNLFTAILLFLGGLFLADFLKKIIQSATSSFNGQVGSILANFVFYFLLINVAMMSLSQAGIETDAIKDNISIILGGIIAAFAIGYGFASQPLLKSMLSAYYNRKKISRGDTVTIDGISGIVVAVDSTSFSLQGKEGQIIIIPLSKLLSETYEVKPQEVVPIFPPSGPNPEG